MKELFAEHAFTPDSRAVITIVNGILDEYDALGYDLSLRQLYYQLVARGHIENSQRSYKRTGDLVSNARIAGLIDWDMIKDRGRSHVTPPHWANPGQIISAAAEQFRIDKWADQPVHVEVYVEKQALEGVLIPVCQSLDVGFSANKGYSSSSALYEAGRRIKAHRRAGKEIAVLYLGDHDPSGIDMTRDVLERLEMFSRGPVKVERIALNFDQVARLNPPENPAKETDARYAAYVEQYGESSWELDAIEPRALAALVTAAVEDLRDPALWDAALTREDHMRRILNDFADTYQDGEA